MKSAAWLAHPSRAVRKPPQISARRVLPWAWASASCRHSHSAAPRSRSRHLTSNIELHARPSTTNPAPPAAEIASPRLVPYVLPDPYPFATSRWVEDGQCCEFYSRASSAWLMSILTSASQMNDRMGTGIHISMAMTAWGSSKFNTNLPATQATCH